ncbi:24877_t:CDS:2 [Dentiscutata erythropus]|uniref:24877_t:CDS:1 n=1 Tax=Dentiscutata erythropus TaxID=1348616 RepID=A0A9N9GXD1_9GLOM|nr:24877_t:CDS:2 [Dentiscutata erythropus]
MTQSELLENLDGPAPYYCGLRASDIEETKTPVALISGTSKTSKTSNLPEPEINKRSQKGQLETSKLPESIEPISKVINAPSKETDSSKPINEITLTTDMATKTATPKTRKPKVNNFVLVLEQFLEKHNLTADYTPEQLNKHAPKLDVLLPDWMARRCVKVALARGTNNRRSFSEEQIEALLPDKRKRKLTIEERAKYCAKIGDAMDIFTHHLDLVEGGVSPKIITTYAKDPKLIQESNKIQKKQTKKRMANPDRIPIHFSSARVLKGFRIWISAEVRSLQIIHYEPDPLNAPVWYKEGYSWYCTGYLKSRGEKKKNLEPRLFLSMEKNPERARELLTWIQDAIKVKKLSDFVFTRNETHNAWPFNEFLKQEPYRTIPKKLRDYRSKHASRIHSGKKPTPQHLKLLSRIAMRQESDHLDAGDNYAIGDTESEESDSEPEISDSPKPQTQGS